MFIIDKCEMVGVKTSFWVLIITYSRLTKVYGMEMLRFSQHFG